MDDERVEELEAITAIYPEFELNNGHGGTLEIPVRPLKPLLVRFTPSLHDDEHADLRAHIEHDVSFTALPPIILEVTLPVGYPESAAPKVMVKSRHEWLPAETRTGLEDDAVTVWEEYAHGQCLFAYIDHVQNRAESGFGLDDDGCLALPQHLEELLTTYEAKTKQIEFDKGTYDCGICLEPKKGSVCYRIADCGHVFCKQCLQEFYINAIEGGDVAVVRCLDPDCGKESGTKPRNLHPRELLAMGIGDIQARRYVEMKRKKRLESDKTTVWCPRSWCQGAARTPKYPAIPKDLRQYVEFAEIASNDEPRHTTAQAPGAADDERLCICEKCQFAFCRICFASWHGSFVRCRPRDPSELTAEEKASYDYIRQHTSPCPTCSSPTQKTMGCNHMHCFQCRTHFCYLCGAWLDGANPYEHFNTPGRECYQRLWELEAGDEGQAPADGRGFGGARAWEVLDVADGVAEEEEEEEWVDNGDEAFVLPPAEVRARRLAANIARARQHPELAEVFLGRHAAEILRAAG